MKVKVENLGILRTAEFEVGDLTIIYGKNNTGKTYAVYALYGFLENFIRNSAKHNRVELEEKSEQGALPDIKIFLRLVDGKPKWEQAPDPLEDIDHDSTHLTLLIWNSVSNPDYLVPNPKPDSEIGRNGEPPCNGQEPECFS